MIFITMFFGFYSLIITVQAVRLTLSTRRKILAATAREAEARRQLDPEKYVRAGRESELADMTAYADASNGDAEFYKQATEDLIEKGIDSTDRRTRSHAVGVGNQVSSYEDKRIKHKRKSLGLMEVAQLDPELSSQSSTVEVIGNVRTLPITH